MFNSPHHFTDWLSQFKRKFRPDLQNRLQIGKWKPLSFRGRKKEGHRRGGGGLLTGTDLPHPPGGPIGQTNLS